MKPGELEQLRLKAEEAQRRYENLPPPPINPQWEREALNAMRLTKAAYEQALRRHR